MFYLVTDRGFSGGLGDLREGGPPRFVTNYSVAKEFETYRDAETVALMLKARGKIKKYDIMMIVERSAGNVSNRADGTGSAEPSGVGSAGADGGISGSVWE